MCRECGGSGSPPAGEKQAGGLAADSPNAPVDDLARWARLQADARKTLDELTRLAVRYAPSVPSAQDPRRTSTVGCSNCVRGRHGGVPIFQPVDPSYVGDDLCGWCGRFRHDYGVLPTATMCELHKANRNVTRKMRDFAFGDVPAYRQRLAERARTGGLEDGDVAEYTGVLAEQSRALGDGVGSTS